LVLILKEVRDISHFTFYQRLYDGFNNQVGKVSIWLYGTGGQLRSKEQNIPLSRAGPPMQQGDTFGASVELSHTVSDVKRIEIYIVETDDSDDSGFAEISILHKCDSPPPQAPSSPPPVPSPPKSPPPAASFHAFNGAVDGTRIAYAWPGRLGGSGGSSSTTSTIGFTANECSQFCGSFQSGSHVQFYTASIETLPHTLFQCTCYNASSWTVVDPNPTSVFIHGASTGTANPMLSSVVMPADNLESGYIKPTYARIVRVPVPPTTTAFDITITIFTESILTPGNIFRISPWRLNDCRPCLTLANDGTFQANLMFSEKGWWKFVSTQHSVRPRTEYTIRIVLHDRKLSLMVDFGSQTNTEPMAEAHAGLSLAGEFPHNERQVFFASKSNNNNGPPTGVLMNLDSIRIQGGLLSHQTMDFRFEANDLLKNHIRYHMGFEAPSFSHASQLASYATASPSTAVATTSGHTGGGVVFDRHSALVLQTSEVYLTQCFTTCVWMKRTMPIDTLFTTILGFGEQLVLHYEAYFDDISLKLGDHNLRATPTSLAEPGTYWSHFCVSVAPVGGHAILYANGTRVGSVLRDHQTAAPNVPFAVGASIDPVVFEQTGNDRGFGGVIDELKSWARQLTDAEIHDVFSSG
jgi:hypothetical protein